jgi:hypothetical protein
MADRPQRASDYAHGISGNCGPLSAGAPGPCPWSDVTGIVIWEYNYLKIIGITRRGDAAGYGTADEATATTVRTPRQARRSQHKAHRQQRPRYPAIMAPDGTPNGAANLVTTNGWCVNADLLVAAARRFAPHVQVTDLSGILWPQRTPGPAPRIRRPSDDLPFEFLFSLIELIGWRRFWWMLGVALSAFLLFAAGSHLGPALRAARGAGTRGTWVAEQCDGSPGECTWYGEFVLPDGTIAQRHVEYTGTVTPGYAGQTLPALDSGADGEVYPVSGTDRWINDVIGVTAGGLALPLLIGRWLFVCRRRWRSRRAANRLISDRDGATGSGHRP